MGLMSEQIFMKKVRLDMAEYINTTFWLLTEKGSWRMLLIESGRTDFTRVVNTRV